VSDHVIRNNEGHSPAVFTTEETGKDCEVHNSKQPFELSQCDSYISTGLYTYWLRPIL